MPKTPTTLKPAAFAKTWVPSINIEFPAKDKKSRTFTLSLDSRNMTLMVCEDFFVVGGNPYVVCDGIDPCGRYTKAAREVAAEFVLINVIAAEDIEPAVRHLAALIKAMTEAMPPEDEIPE